MSDWTDQQKAWNITVVDATIRLIGPVKPISFISTSRDRRHLDKICIRIQVGRLRMDVYG